MDEIAGVRFRGLPIRMPTRTTDSVQKIAGSVPYSSVSFSHAYIQAVSHCSPPNPHIALCHHGNKLSVINATVLVSKRQTSAIRSKLCRKQAATQTLYGLRSSKVLQWQISQMYLSIIACQKNVCIIWRASMPQVTSVDIFNRELMKVYAPRHYSLVLGTGTRTSTI